MVAVFIICVSLLTSFTNPNLHDGHKDPVEQWEKNIVVEDDELT